jgi:hypothetical protein
MTLKFRRNLPLVLMLIGILSLLALTMGDQQIVSYTVNTQALQAAVQVSDVRMVMAGMFGAVP